MSRYFMEVPHSESEEECARVVQYFLKTGSHYLMNADWGCSDGEHKAWIVLDAETKEQARSVLPPMFQPEAKIVKLNKFTMEEVNEMLGHHKS